jgi:TolA-binding protein
MDANPVKPVQVQVAETNAQSREKIAQGSQAIDTQQVQNEHTQAAADATIRLHEAQTEIEALKTRLAETSMKLNMQQQLNSQDIAAELHKHYNAGAQPAGKPPKPGRDAMKPPVQVPGKAGPGKAFSQAPG